MPAHIIDRRQVCAEFGCHVRSSFEVRDTYNGSHGVYCRFHAQRKVDQLNALESEPRVYRKTSDPTDRMTP